MHTKAAAAALIALLNLAIIHWSLCENKAYEQISMFQTESCAKQQIQIEHLS